MQETRVSRMAQQFAPIDTGLSIARKFTMRTFVEFFC